MLQIKRNIVHLLNPPQIILIAGNLTGLLKAKERKGWTLL